MAVTPVSEGGDALERVRRENQTLYAVIKTVSSSLALDRVLDGIVDIATDATGLPRLLRLLPGGRAARAARGAARSTRTWSASSAGGSTRA